MKKTTIRDVAQLAGVSISVVSYVLTKNTTVSITEQTRSKVIAAANKLNYIPNNIARSMRTGRSMVLGLASFWNVSDKVFTDILKGIYDVAEKSGYSLNYCSIRDGDNARSIIDLYDRKQIDGVILFLHVDSPDYFNEETLLTSIRKRNIPAVIIDGCTCDADTNYIYIDYFQTSFLAVNYLYDLGHRKMCYILPARYEINKRQANERLNGYREGLKSLNIQDNMLYFDTDNISKLGNMIKQREPGSPTAVVVNKSNYAPYLLKSFWEMDIKVPDDVSVIACNDIGIGEFLMPSLTTVRVPSGKIGERSAQILLDILKGSNQVHKIRFDNEIIKRDSCSLLK